MWKQGYSEPHAYNFTTSNISIFDTNSPHNIWFSGGSAGGKIVKYNNLIVSADTGSYDKSTIYSKFGNNIRYASGFSGHRNGGITGNGTWIFTSAYSNALNSVTVVGMRISDHQFKTSCSSNALPNAHDMAYGSDGKIYLSGRSNKINKLDFNTCTYVTISPSGAGAFYRFAAPSPVGYVAAIDHEGPTKGIWIIYSNGTSINYPYANGDGLESPIYYHMENAIWMVDYLHNAIVKFDLFSKTYTTYPAPTAGMEPTGLSRVGNTFYVSDRFGYKIAIFNIATTTWNSTVLNVPGQLKPTFGFIGASVWPHDACHTGGYNNLDGNPIFAISTATSTFGTTDGFPHTFTDAMLVYDTTNKKFVLANTRSWNDGFYAYVAYTILAPSSSDPYKLSLWTPYRDNSALDVGNTDRMIGFIEAEIGVRTH